MAFNRCPECGESNFEEQTGSYVRKFDCGFHGFFDERRKRCGSTTGEASTLSIPAEVARYRLALLDAAQAAETIANDMKTQDVDAIWPSRCLELARQMREFAGHTADFGGGPRSKPTGTSLISKVRKAWSR